MYKAALLSFAVLLAAAATVSAQTTLAPLSTAQLVGVQGNSRDSDTAYNDKAKVYLTVWGHPALLGRFTSADGVPLGTEFVISNLGPSDAMPRVAYSSGSADDVFLVVYSTESRGVAHYMRSVRYTPSGPDMGDIQPLDPVPSASAGTGGLAYSPSRRQFFCTWQSSSSGTYAAYGALVQVGGTTVDPTMTVGTIFNIGHGDPDLGTPNVAYDWKHDTYMVVYWASNYSGIYARRVTFDPATNAPTLEAPMNITSSGAPFEPNIVYMPEADAFLAHWTAIGGTWGGGRDVGARVIDHAAASGGSTFPAIATSSNEGAADADYSPYTRTIVLTAMRDATKYVQGMVLDGSGNLMYDFPASTALPAPSMESLMPHTAVGEDGRFALSYINNFAYVWVDILQGPVVPGGSFQTPPVPPCVATISANPASFGPTGGTGAVAVTAATPAGCTWTATSNASWARITSGSSVTGVGSVGYAVDSNPTDTARTATLTIGGKAFTISQAGRVLAASRSDFNGDGRFDLMWQHADGSLVLWTMNGTSLIDSAPLSPGRVTDTNWRIVGTGDFNSDGQPDLVWQHIVTGYLVVWYMNGASLLDSVYVVPNRVPDTNWRIVAVGDMNGDRRPDLIWRHRVDGYLVVWLMNGIRLLDSAYLTPNRVPDANWMIVGTADMNGDGKEDLVWQHATGGWLVVWYMNGRSLIDSVYLNPGQIDDMSWRIVATGDVNADGRPDLIWRNTTSGRVATWLMNGRTLLRHIELNLVPDTNWSIVGPR